MGGPEKPEMRIRNGTIAVLVTLSCLGCLQFKAGYYEDDKKAALLALEAFHDRLGAGDFDAIYDNASPELRARPKAELVTAMNETRERWGKLVRADIKAASCFPSEVRFIVQAEFEKGLAGEMITWSVPADKALLQHFQIFPGPIDVPQGAANECKSGT